MISYSKRVPSFHQVRGFLFPLLLVIKSIMVF